MREVKTSLVRESSTVISFMETLVESHATAKATERHVGLLSTSRVVLICALNRKFTNKQEWKCSLHIN